MYYRLVARPYSAPEPASLEFLRLAGDPVRWQLLRELARSDRRVQELTGLTGRPQNVVSYHLGQLRSAGLVSARRSSADGRDAYYRVDLPRFGRLLAETGRILLEAAPEGYAPKDIIAAIMSRPAVASVHDVHVWLITSGFPALSAHVLVRRPADCHQVRRDLEQLLCERFGLDHTTLQVDHAPDELLSIGGEQR